MDGEGKLGWKGVAASAVLFFTSYSNNKEPVCHLFRVFDSCLTRADPFTGSKDTRENPDTDKSFGNTEELYGILLRI